MRYNKVFFNKVFSSHRMKRYYDLYPANEAAASTHYIYNLQLSESLYTSISVFEVSLRNALCRELTKMSKHKNWYEIFADIPELSTLNNYIIKATKLITNRHEQVSSEKITAELTLGFWVSLLNREYERILWKDLRRAFPFMPKSIRQRKNISAPLNRFRSLRNRVFHNEPICWNVDSVIKLHQEMATVLGWIDKELPEWLLQYDRFPVVSNNVMKNLSAGS